MGKVLKRVHQVCHSHGLHLAVTDVIYKKKTSEAVIEEDSTSSSEEESDGEDNEDAEEVTDSEEESDDCSDSESVVEQVESEEDLVLISEIDEIVKKIRKAVKTFKKSPLKNDALQAKIKESAKKKAGTIIWSHLTVKL